MIAAIGCARSIWSPRFSKEERKMTQARTAVALCSIVALTTFATFAVAQTPPPTPVAPAAAAPPGPDLAARVADLEAYVTNGTPKFLTTTSGPGHNGWMMTSSALVLF